MFLHFGNLGKTCTMSNTRICTAFLKLGMIV